MDDDDGTNVGAGYVFKKDEGGSDNWGQIKKLTPGSNSDNYRLGEFSLDINDNYINPTGSKMLWNSGKLNGAAHKLKNLVIQV